MTDGERNNGFDWSEDAVYQVTLQLEPMFKRSITNRVQRDEDFEKTVSSFAATTEFGDITWFPGQGKVVYRDDVRLPLTAAGKGKNDFQIFQPQLSVLAAALRKSGPILKTFKPNFHTSPALFPSSFRRAAGCDGERGGKMSPCNDPGQLWLATGGGLKNDESEVIDFTGYPVVGNQSDMQSSGSCLFGKEDGLLTACGWDPRIEGLFFHQTTSGIPIAQVPDFIADVKKLRELRPGSLCGLDLYGGVLIRFLKKSTALLGKTDDSAEFDMIYFRSRDPENPRLDEDVLEEMEQMAFFKYGALPHLGKNRPVGFIGVEDKFGDR